MYVIGKCSICGKTTICQLVETYNWDNDLVVRLRCGNCYGILKKGIYKNNLKVFMRRDIYTAVIYTHDSPFYSQFMGL